MAMFLWRSYTMVGQQTEPFGQNISKMPQWLNNGHKPPWMDLHLDALSAGMKTLPESVSNLIECPGANERLGPQEIPLDIGMCRKLCESGRISDAVDALDRRVQRGCYVHINLFYLVLKRCIADKDLVIFRRIHALTVKSGYEGDSFLATHLISLYASYGSLELARQVFRKVPIPTVYNWTAIIFAYAREGGAVQAIRLYRQALESNTVTPNNRLYVAVLKACATSGDLDAGKEVHSHILAFPGKPDIFVQSGLVNMYSKCGSLRDARMVFDSLAEKDVVVWNVMLGGYAQQGLGHKALSLYISMKQEDFTPANSVTYVCLLKACASVGARALDQGKQLHAEIEERGLDLVLGGSLVNMYAKCGSLGDACRVFDRLPRRDVVTWTALFAGYTQQGMGQQALRLYNQMQEEGLTRPNSVTYVCLLQACASVGVAAVDQGKQLHAQIEEQGLQVDLVLGGSLVNMYAKCGSLGDARMLFDRLPVRHVVTWTALIAAYAQQGMGEEALSLYHNMQQEGLIVPNTVTYACLLQACASLGAGALDNGKKLYAEIEERGLRDDLVLGGSLVNMYVKCGSLRNAHIVFDRLPVRDVVTWTTLIAGYAQQGMGQEALSLYSSMQQEGLNAPNSFTYACLLQACASVGVGAVEQGKHFHAEIEEQGLQEDLVLCGSLVNMYAKCSCLGDARRVFDRLPQRDVVTWTALIAGYCQQGMGEEALSLYSRMHEEGLTPPNSVTYVCLLQACATVGLGAMNQGKQLHAEIEERGLQDDLVLGGSLVNMYAKCGSLGDARWVFDRLPERDVVTWTALIAGYAQQGMGQEALGLYCQMQQQGLSPPNSVTYVCLLQACASVAALPLGKQLHEQIEERGLQADVVVGAGLVNMYAKCGSMLESQQVLDSLPERSIEAWNALTSGYARQVDSQVVFDLVDRMRLEGTKPDGITFLCLLTVCSHLGEVDKGRKYFEVMKLDYGINPTLEHYACMVDLLGRAGHLGEALRMAKTMPFIPDITVWLALLGACRKWKNVEIGQQAFEFAVTEDRNDAAPYLLMSNIYASAEMWKEAKEMQARRVKLGVSKIPGQSWWTDLAGVVHTFVVGDIQISPVP